MHPHVRRAHNSSNDHHSRGRGAFLWLRGGADSEPTSRPNPAPTPYVRSATCLALDARKANQEAEALQLDANSKQLMDDSFTMTDQTQASTARIQADTMRLQALNLRTDHEAELSAQCLMESDTR